MVECEFYQKQLYLARIFVLIDTWWNVNCIPRSSFLCFGRVLIDTWWNVNELIHAVQGTRDLSFNRYMVECE